MQSCFQGDKHVVTEDASVNKRKKNFKVFSAHAPIVRVSYADW